MINRILEWRWEEISVGIMLCWMSTRETGGVIRMMWSRSIVISKAEARAGMDQTGISSRAKASSLITTRSRQKKSTPQSTSHPASKSKTNTSFRLRIPPRHKNNINTVFYLPKWTLSTATNRPAPNRYNLYCIKTNNGRTTTARIACAQCISTRQRSD